MYGRHRRKFRIGQDAIQITACPKFRCVRKSVVGSYDVAFSGTRIRLPGWEMANWMRRPSLLDYPACLIPPLRIAHSPFLCSSVSKTRFGFIEQLLAREDFALDGLKGGTPFCDSATVTGTPTGNRPIQMGAPIPHWGDRWRMAMVFSRPSAGRGSGGM